MTGPATTAARKATARAAGAQRTLVGLIGVLGLGAGVAALVVGSGLLGADRAARPVLDPVALNTLSAHQSLARAAAVAAGVALLVAGLIWAARAIKPEHRPNLLLDPRSTSRLEISASAIADALRADAETIPGVNRVRARTVGRTATPVLRLTLWLEDGANVRDVYHDLDTGVLTRARDSLGIESLPAAIRLELDAATPARVT
ncbi:MAG TPA: alkaline shock response membrane anchor protein AmaP [Pseudonocardiaceae bacterium]